MRFRASLHHRLGIVVLVVRNGCYDNLRLGEFIFRCRLDVDLHLVSESAGTGLAHVSSRDLVRGLADRLWAGIGYYSPDGVYLRFGAFTEVRASSPLYIKCLSHFGWERCYIQRVENQ